ncbi:hypothetical protein [Isosphaera pallida]|nr:hypothetical protein [Isosphaera pallida]
MVNAPRLTPLPTSTTLSTVSGPYLALLPTPHTLLTAIVPDDDAARPSS